MLEQELFLVQRNILSFWSNIYHAIEKGRGLTLCSAQSELGKIHKSPTNVVQLLQNPQCFSICFRFTVTKLGSDSGRCFLLVDSTKVFYLSEHTSGGHPQSSATINLFVTAGQVVQVQNDVNGSSNYQNAYITVFGTYNLEMIYTWFTGFLLYAAWFVTQSVYFKEN